MARVIDIPDIPRLRRVRLGLTQREVAEMARTSTRTLSTIEAGGDASLSIIRRCASAVRTPVGEYVAGMEVSRQMPRSRRRTTARGAKLRRRRAS